MDADECYSVVVNTCGVDTFLKGVWSASMEKLCFPSVHMLKEIQGKRTTAERKTLSGRFLSLLDENGFHVTNPAS